MNISERLIADYTGTGLTVGPHPLTFRRTELAMRGVMPAIELPRQRAGRRVRTAGMVITRQRPGTAKGFVFLTLEDETGISNIIIRPDLYATDRLIVVEVVVPAGRGHAAEPGRRHVDQGRADVEARWHAGRSGDRFARFPLD